MAQLLRAAVIAFTYDALCSACTHRGMAMYASGCRQEAEKRPLFYVLHVCVAAQVRVFFHIVLQGVRNATLRTHIYIFPSPCQQYAEVRL
jgi:hypothetical protein